MTKEQINKLIVKYNKYMNKSDYYREKAYKIHEKLFFEINKDSRFLNSLMRGDTE